MSLITNNFIASDLRGNIMQSKDACFNKNTYRVHMSEGRWGSFAHAPYTEVHRSRKYFTLQENITQETNHISEVQCTIDIVGCL